MIFLLKFLQSKTLVLHLYIIIIQWYCEILIGSFCKWRHKFARSWSICVILSDQCIIVPLLNDKWFLFHKLYYPKLLWFIYMVQWYCEILILVLFASNGTCQILEPTVCFILSDHCINVPHLNDKWVFFQKLYHPKLLWFIHMVHWYCEILILAHFASDGTCQILKPMCHSEWPPYYCSTFKWKLILLS